MAERTGVTVAYIGGYGRSGSTLLSLILGKIPGFVSVGELHRIWERGLIGNELCGCGLPFRDCPFWHSVGEEAFGGWDSVDAHELARVRQTVIRRRSVPRFLFPTMFPDFSARVTSYSNHIERLYLALANISQSSVIVDSSKVVTGALLLGWMRNIDPRVVHLVRDSRGTSFSWLRQTVRPEVTNRVEYMDTYSPRHTALNWLLVNLSFHSVEHLRIDRLFVRYESLVSSGQEELTRILDFLDAGEGADRSFLDRDYVEIGRAHTVAGNPLRFQQGVTPLRVDDEWRQKMDRRSRTLVLLLTWPLLLRYGYLTSSERSSAHALLKSWGTSDFRNRARHRVGDLRAVRGRSGGKRPQR
ncbi:MAG: sulfotransferase [Actinomycetota bacterium]|nr:sulfotransferase [Actinomycetota bacterium]